MLNISKVQNINAVGGKGKKIFRKIKTEHIDFNPTSQLNITSNHQTNSTNINSLPSNIIEHNHVLFYQCRDRCDKVDTKRMFLTSHIAFIGRLRRQVWQPNNVIHVSVVATLRVSSPLCPSHDYLSLSPSPSPFLNTTGMLLNTMRILHFYLLLL